MWLFLLVANLYFLSVGIRSIYENGAETVNVIMVVCFTIIGIVCGISAWLDWKERGRK